MKIYETISAQIDIIFRVVKAFRYVFGVIDKGRVDCFADKVVIEAYARWASGSFPFHDSGACKRFSIKS